MAKQTISLHCFNFVFLSSPAFAGPYNCHAYTLFQLTGIKPNFGQDITILTDWLEKNGYSRHSFSAGTDWKTLDTRLIDGGVMTIPPKHSGIVENGRVRHFTKASKTLKITAKENVDTLQSLMNKESLVQKFQSNGTVNYRKMYLYKDKSVVLWRKTSPNAGHEKVICRGPADGEIGAWIQGSNGCYNIPRERKKRTKFEDSRPNVNGKGMFDNPYGTTPGFNW